MTRPVVAIGLDAADPILLEQWMEQGHLKTLNRLRQQGAYGRLSSVNHYKAETPWTVFLTGALPEQTGYWGGIKVKNGTYDVENVGAYDFAAYPPFYALGEDYRVAAVDLPKGTLSDAVNGIQVLAWGAHSPGTPSHSLPNHVLPDLIRRYGHHPALHKDHGDWWDDAYLTRLYRALQTGIARRAAMGRDLLQQEDWNLFLTVFSEPHSAGHDFWCYSQPDHPLYPYVQQKLKDISANPLLDMFVAVDEAIATILESAPTDADVIVFSVHGSDHNTTDVPSMFLLGEWLYRFNFPGKAMIAPGTVGAPVPPLLLSPKRKTWSGEVWQLKHDPNPIRALLRRSLPSKFHPSIDRYLGSAQTPDLASPQQLQAAADPFFWQPVSWYKPFWPQMKAYALPSFSEGYIRVNLKGREPQGQVEPADYEALCQTLTDHLHELVNPRTGAAVVKKVVRSRQTPLDTDPTLPGADLIVEWDDVPTDVIDSPGFGRIGPVPYRRTGSHRARGFLLATGNGISPGTQLQQGDIIDLAPTILARMGAPIPSRLEGHPLLQPDAMAIAAP
ncbi:alkaline phosphatase family protein [Oculatella sp. LEGE 06141]|uniref:alkaline phosphatase family protein n=1 Tax=Oculatella sp. LEGE 06141 TaxID=1828648 RepID=UPI00187F2597|nr:alkaline phosphatase family protein [Oculatella sp. LEGE 06141]MBE9182205.1 alkaline phosphatase family protein [Oculatella sp. LEGE 06141]